MAGWHHKHPFRDFFTHHHIATRETWPGDRCYVPAVRPAVPPKKIDVRPDVTEGTARALQQKCPMALQHHEKLGPSRSEVPPD